MPVETRSQKRRLLAEQCFQLSRLPTEIVAKVLELLPSSDRKKFRAVSKRFKKMIDGNRRLQQEDIRDLDITPTHIFGRSGDGHHFSHFFGDDGFTSLASVLRNSYIEEMGHRFEDSSGRRDVAQLGVRMEAFMELLQGGDTWIGAFHYDFFDKGPDLNELIRLANPRVLVLQPEGTIDIEILKIPPRCKDLCLPGKWAFKQKIVFHEACSLKRIELYSCRAEFPSHSKGKFNEAFIDKMQEFLPIDSFLRQPTIEFCEAVQTIGFKIRSIRSCRSLQVVCDNEEFSNEKNFEQKII